ncbi:MAG: SEC59/DGK1/VTE5 family protein [Candidatus Cloacimonetes bacterium]|nr:SEC59/DGK1/VTE5 family protein [Candidatus Cloacimonadota bacterium]
MQHKIRTEVLRKLIHMSSLIIPLGYRYIVHEDRKVMFLIMLPLTLIMLIVEIVRLEHKTFKRVFFKTFGIMLRRHEESNFTGATYLMVSSVVCIAFFPGHNIAFLALSSLAVGDTLAAIVGMSLGRRKFVGSKKSLEGSLACFTGIMAFGLVFGVNPTLTFIGALVATLAELSRYPLDDNIKIPLSVALAMALARFIFI